MKTLLIKEFKEQWRSKRLLSSLIVFSIFGILSPLAARFMPDFIANMTKEQAINIIVPEPVWTDALLQYVKNISQMCSFILIILTMGIIAKEKESGTMIFLFVKPVKRSSFILSKFMIQYLSAFISLLIASSFCFFYTYLFFEEADIMIFLKINAILLLFVMFIQSLTLFYSTLFKSSIPAGLLAFFTWLISGLWGQIKVIGPYSPSRLVKQSEQVIAGATLQWEPFATTFVLFAVLLGLSIWFCEKWDTE